MSEQEKIMQGLYDSVVAGNEVAAREFAEQSLAAGIAPLEALQGGLTAGIKEIGDRFGRGELFLPEMVMSADAMQAAVEVLEPHLGDEDIEMKAKILMGSAKGDIHDIGKNIAAAVLAVNGYEIIDIGRDVSPADFVDRAVDGGVDIVGMSSLMTTSLPYLAETIELMEEDGVRDQFKVIIGGGPTSQVYADKIGADGYAATASEAVQLCDRLIE